MEKETYRERLNSPEFEEVILPIFDFFEPFIHQELKFNESEDKNYLEESVLEYYQMLVEQNIRESISVLRKKVSSEDYVAMRSFVLSLQQNTIQFLTNEKYRSRVKWKKILNSYINVSRIFLEKEKIQLLQDGFPVEGQQIVLAMSLIDPQDDNIKANDEIQNICDLFTNNPNVIVVPIHGCSTDVFRTILDRLPILNIIHLAGHTDTKTNGEVLLSFVDSNMTFKKFSNWISNRRFRCSFLNCCSTAEFVSNLDSLYSDCSILHSGQVVSSIAFDFSEHFYTVISSGGDFNAAWQAAVKNCTESPFNYLYC
ncbi:hypothetical protein J7S27_04375 [Carnobacteriaceae bacterium zg-C25]|nr:hypothetical protein J7S27_04375 [Carnobacteriaceae bacterium zg-C25]